MATTGTVQTLVQIGSVGASPQLVKYNTFVTFLTVLYFFSILRPGRTVGPIFTLYGSNDAFPRKEVPSGSRTIGNVISGNVP